MLWAIYFESYSQNTNSLEHANGEMPSFTFHDFITYTDNKIKVKKSTSIQWKNLSAYVKRVFIFYHFVYGDPKSQGMSNLHFQSIDVSYVF